jgi:hypothetical protein
LPRTCPKCGRNVQDDAALFCPYCGIELVTTRTAAPPLKDTGFPLVAGVLTIVAACISSVIGTIEVFAFAAGRSSYLYFIIGMFGFLAFAFGLTGGIFSTERKQFALSVTGTSLVLAFGFVMIFTSALTGSVAGGLLFGSPVLFLSFLSMIFVGVSKGDFSQPTC